MSDRTIRRDPLTGNCVIFAPQRGRRPGTRPVRPIDEREKSTSRCPFCPGHEAETPDAIEERTAPESSLPWLTRVFENKFAAVGSPDEGVEHTRGLFTSTAAEGRHEVIVETPLHMHDIPDMSADELVAMLRTYSSRVHAVRSEEPKLHPVLFKNHGPKAGATLRHPHAQLVAMPVRPPGVRTRERRAETFFDRRQRCLTCAIRKQEMKARERVLAVDDFFTSFVPYAANVPYEMMIIPRRHHADIADLSDEETSSLARHLFTLTTALREELYDPDYNLLFILPSPAHLQHPGAHWYLVLRPRYGSDAGFERSTGMHINASWPEDNARLIRATIGRTAQSANPVNRHSPEW